jgi:hypothetical protein
MNYFTLFILSLILPITLFGQETKTIRLADFTEIAVFGRFTVDVKYGEEPFANMTIGYDDVDPEKVQFNYSGEKLTIKYIASVISDKDLNITIYTPKIHRVDARSGAEIRVDKSFVLTNSTVVLSSASGGKIQATVDTPWLEASVSQGGSVSVQGNATLFEAKVKTGGTIGSVNLHAKKVEAEVQLGGEIICYAEEILKASVSGGGTISYTGPAEVSESIKLGGNIEKMN